MLIVFAAGIKTNISDNQFGGMKEQLIKRYADVGKTAVFLDQDTLFPIGEGKDNNPAYQMYLVGQNMRNGTGGELIDNKVGIYLLQHVKPNELVLIGHSGGGQAVGDALVDLENSGINVTHVVQIGAPSEPIKTEYADKVIRVQTSTDIVSKWVPSTGTAFLDNPDNAASALSDQVDTTTMPETEIVDIGIGPDDHFGGHTSYFNPQLKNNSGVNNLTTTLNAFWDTIK